LSPLPVETVPGPPFLPTSYFEDNHPSVFGAFSSKVSLPVPPLFLGKLSLRSRTRVSCSESGCFFDHASAAFCASS
jgi:hypothetical protein